MSRRSRGIVPFLTLLFTSVSWAGSSQLPVLAQQLQTHDDGRDAIQSVYGAYETLVNTGWTLDVIAESHPAGAERALPIIALRSPVKGPAAWFLTGIHGEEPAGPQALARSVDALAELGERYPVVLLPLNNPHGYARNWRYLNVAVYSKDIDGQSVGDSSHLLLAEGETPSPRAPAASSPEAGAITRYILETSVHYPPRYSIDLHEDNLIHAGYVYSQGVEGAADPLATEAVNILRANDIQIKMSGTTRFDEPIEGGIIGPVTDSSVDELMSAETIWLDGETARGPKAHTVLVFETPAASVSMARRVQAHEDLVRRLVRLIGKETG